MHTGIIDLFKPVKGDPAPCGSVIATVWNKQQDHELIVTVVVSTGDRLKPREGRPPSESVYARVWNKQQDHELLLLLLFLQVIDLLKPVKGDPRADQFLLEYEAHYEKLMISESNREKMRKEVCSGTLLFRQPQGCCHKLIPIGHNLMSWTLRHQ